MYVVEHKRNAQQIHLAAQQLVDSPVAAIMQYLRELRAVGEVESYGDRFEVFRCESVGVFVRDQLPDGGPFLNPVQLPLDL
jgi:hypothetical protein